MAASFASSSASTSPTSCTSDLPTSDGGAGHLQEAFALKCGIDRSRYGGIERGERNPSLSTVFKIANTLSVRPSEIHALVEQNRHRVSYA
jgi:DNA-binding XRE family transcriptional regulator